MTESVDPATEETLDSYETHGEGDVDDLLDRASDAFEEWREQPTAEREALLERAGEVLRENSDEYAELMTVEMGKPVEQSRSEVEMCAWVRDFYAERAAAFLQDEHVGGETDADTFVARQPLGPVLAIMPWHFPFWQVFRFAAPTLTAGNVGLLKHASNVPGCAKVIEDVFREAGYPEDVFATLLVGSDAIGVRRDDRVRAVTITGSEGAGHNVAETAGKTLEKHVLELGGSDPFVVLDDAPLERACEVGVRARVISSGRSCIAAKRLIVHEDVYDDFLGGFLNETEALRTGDPTDDDTDAGPQAREGLVEDRHEQVEATVEQGAEVRFGGEPMDRDGHFYPPTVVTDVPEGSPADDEEVFGPVATVFEVPDGEAAIAKANDIDYGLGASVWTEELERVARRFESGLAFVNELVQSDPGLPFGGVKDSGYGRELAKQGIREFVNEQTVRVSHGPSKEGDPAE